jgi:hypothetical protein
MIEAREKEEEGGVIMQEEGMEEEDATEGDALESRNALDILRAYRKKCGLPATPDFKNYGASKGLLRDISCRLR